MPTKPAVTMQDLELERAELLPSRETLYVAKGYGIATQSGLLNVSLLNGDLNNILSLGSGNIV
jgi:hypothetical protein